MQKVDLFNPHSGINATSNHPQREPIGQLTVIGASVSEPHIDEFNVNFLYFYIYNKKHLKCNRM